MAFIVIRTLLDLFVIVLIARAIASWVRVGPDSSMWPIVSGLYGVTEPVLAPIRRVIPPIGGLDLSVLVLIFGIRLVLVPALAAVLR